jgi:hypothetical protein
LTRMRGRGMPGYYHSVPPGQKLSSLFKLTLMGLRPARLLKNFGQISLVELSLASARSLCFSF